MKNIRFSIEDALEKMIGTVGKSLPISSAIKFSLSEMTCSSQTQNDLKRVFYQMSQTQFLSRLIKSAHFPKHLTRLKWQQNGYTAVISHAAVKRKIIADIAAVNAGQIKQAHRAEQTELQNTISFENRRRTLRYRAIRKILIIKQQTILG